MTRGKAPDGSFQRFEYDSAGRIAVIKADNGTVLETYTYGASRERVKKTVANGDKTYYTWGGSSVIAEYSETASQTTMNWAKSYIYAGSRLLSTITKSGSSELTEYHHPDRLGTKLVTDTMANTAKAQGTLPFGTLIDAETIATTNRRFTSYDRSGATGLDYAVNRTYNSGQSRFTQVDPIGMASASIGDPQSLNLFAYTRNNPVDFDDPSGLNAEGPVYTVDVPISFGGGVSWLFWHSLFGDGGSSSGGELGDDGGGHGGGGEESEPDPCAQALKRSAGFNQEKNMIHALANVYRDIIFNSSDFDKNGMHQTGRLYTRDGTDLKATASISNRTLAAIAMVESNGGLVMQQRGGNSIRKGGAMGYFQIDNPSVTVAEANDVSYAITYSAYQMSSETVRIGNRLGYDYTNPGIFTPIALMIHNSGGNKDDQKAIKNFMKSGKISDLDKQTTKNYVSRVLDIRGNCF